MERGVVGEVYDVVEGVVFFVGEELCVETDCVEELN